MKDDTALKDYELIYELLASLQTRAQAESNLKVMEANNSYNEINLEPTVTDLIYKPWLLEKLDLTSRQARALNLIRECVDRISKSKPTVGLQITSSSELGEDLRNRLKNKPQEELWGLYLNNKNVVIREECISRGTLNTSE
ncbi:JAB domain-containing protein, partial [Ligilactobacillus agilis]|uniref:JAB domain-containing protein n=1 Tax=Ligilactobacillus agilis TaxID=1601 RepID=UPI00280A7853